MWIAEFSAQAGLSVATVRFYVRQGLLKPTHGTAGSSRPYMVFTPRDLKTANAIRMGQAMGLSLAEIKLLVDERRSGGRRRMLQTMTAQRETLRQRAAEVAALIRFVDAKIEWLKAGSVGEAPEPPAQRPAAKAQPIARVPRQAG